MADPTNEKRPQLPPHEVLRIEAEAERRNAAFVADALKNLGDRCPECGSLGSLEPVGGTIKCVDCDVDVMARSQLPGMGKK